jgi:hypothetical protein
MQHGASYLLFQVTKGWPVRGETYIDFLGSFTDNSVLLLWPTADAISSKTQLVSSIFASARKDLHQDSTHSFPSASRQMPPASAFTIYYLGIRRDSPVPELFATGLNPLTMHLTGSDIFIFLFRFKTDRMSDSPAFRH